MSTSNGTDPGKSFAQLRTIWQSALPHAQKVVLQLLLAYARPTDLIVFHSEGEIAWELGYTTPTVYTALKALRALQILTVLAKGRQQYATVYQIDLTKLPAPRPYPKRRTRPQRINDLYPETESDPGQPINDLYPETAQTINNPAQPINHLHPIDTRETKEESYFLGDPESAPPSSEKKVSAGSRSQTKTKTKTPAPPTIELTDELRTWVRDYARQVDLVFEREKFLQHCRAHEIENRNWVEAFKGWLLEADRRVRANGHRPGVGPDRVLEQLRARRASEAPVEPPPDPLPTPSPDAEAEPPEWVYPYGHNPFHQGGCRTHHREDQPCPAGYGATTDTGIKSGGAIVNVPGAPAEILLPKLES